jgi:hypothetical protein
MAALTRRVELMTAVLVLPQAADRPRRISLDAMLANGGGRVRDRAMADVPERLRVRFIRRVERHSRTVLDGDSVLDPGVRSPA